MPLTSRLVTIVIGLVVLLAAAGIWYSQAKSTPLPAATVTVRNSPYQIDVAINDRQLTVNDTARLTFTVRRDGAVTDIYSEDKVVHYIIASDNYQDFFHTFAPEVQGPGVFYLDHTFTQPGRYRVWTELVDTHKGKELHHNQNAELVSFVDLTVTGQATQALVPITEQTATVGPYQVTYQAQGLKAGQPTTIDVHVTDADGKTVPVFTQEPAIYVMVGPDGSFMSHTHTNPAAANNHIKVTETLPTAGAYLWWTEIYAQEGEAYAALQVPFLLTVTP